MNNYIVHHKEGDKRRNENSDLCKLIIFYSGFSRIIGYLPENLNALINAEKKCVFVYESCNRYHHDPHETFLIGDHYTDIKKLNHDNAIKILNWLNSGSGFMYTIPDDGSPDTDEYWRVKGFILSERPDLYWYARDSYLQFIYEQLREYSEETADSLYLETIM